MMLLFIYGILGLNNISTVLNKILVLFFLLKKRKETRVSMKKITWVKMKLKLLRWSHVGYWGIRVSDISCFLGLWWDGYLLFLGRLRFLILTFDFRTVYFCIIANVIVYIRVEINLLICSIPNNCDWKLLNLLCTCYAH